MFLLKIIIYGKFYVFEILLNFCNTYFFHRSFTYAIYIIGLFLLIFYLVDFQPTFILVSVCVCMGLEYLSISNVQITICCGLGLAYG